MSNQTKARVQNSPSDDKQKVVIDIADIKKPKTNISEAKLWEIAQKVQIIVDRIQDADSQGQSPTPVRK